MGVMHDGVIYVSLDKREIDHGAVYQRRSECWREAPNLWTSGKKSHPPMDGRTSKNFRQENRR